MWRMVRGQCARNRKWLPAGKENRMNKPLENGFATAMKLVAGKWKIEILASSAPRRAGSAGCGVRCQRSARRC